MVLRLVNHLSNTYFSFRNSVSSAQRITHNTMERMANITLETSSDLLTEGLSQLEMMKRVMTIPDIFAIQSSLWSSVGESCMGHLQLSMEEVIEAQIRLNNLVGHNLKEFSPMLQTSKAGSSASQ